jgi:hypothetical protein
MIVGFIKPAVLARDGGIPMTRKKIVMAYSSLLLFLLICIDLTTPKNEEDIESQPEQALIEPGQEMEASAQIVRPQQKTNNEQDAEKLASIYREIKDTEKQLAILEKTLQANVKGQKDRYKLYVAANKLYEAVRAASLKFSMFDVPQLKNKKAERHIKEALAAFSYHLMLRENYVEKFRAWTDGVLEFRPSILSDEIRMVEQATLGQKAAAASIIRAYIELGVNLEKIDLETGNLKP